MVSSSNAPGLKTVRACDSCVRRGAQWYCAADDAFLCQNCDASVHSANPLARRHDRVGLRTNFKQEENVVILPAWHHACKRKARTPRQSKFKKFRLVSSSVVPELETVSTEDGCNDREEERLMYLVPVLDDKTANINIMETIKSNSECFAGFKPSDKELEEFAADMESLLWRGISNDTFSVELGMLIDEKYGSAETGEVKEETDNGDEETDLCRETMDINFDCRSGDEEHGFEAGMEVGVIEEENEEGSKKIGLRLNYEAVSVEWCASNGGETSPWMNGERPQFGPDDCWIDYLEMWVGGGGEMQLGIVQQTDMFGINSRSFNEGREARVSRYRQKRRTRLFSKKIRYEVRKLNAEKRPRMKGRFVKRSSFVA